MKGGDLKFFILAALGIGAGVLAYRSFRSVKDTADKALTDTRGAITDTLERLFGPKLSQAAQESTYFVVRFDENGQQHAIPASSVNEQGRFVYANPPLSSRTYQLYVDKDGKKHARSA